METTIIIIIIKKNMEHGTYREQECNFDNLTVY